MTGINNNFLHRVRIKNDHLKEEKAPLQTEAGEKQLPKNAPAPTAESEAALAQQANYMAMLNKPANSPTNGRGTENDVRNELEAELAALGNTPEEEPVVEPDNIPAPPEMEEPEPIDFDESVIVRSETVESSDNASESGRMNAQSVTKTKTTTDYDSLGRRVRVTVVITKNGEVVETKVTVYQYDGDSQTPSRTQTDTKNGNDELVSRFTTYYREDGTVEDTYDFKYENGKVVDRTDTVYRKDGETVNYTYVYKYENGKCVGKTETYYREDGKTIDKTKEYKRHYYTVTREDGSTYNAFKTLLTHYVKYAEDGETPVKETKYEYDEDGNVTKSITIEYEYDDKGRVIKITTETKDADNKTTTEDVEEFEYEEEDDNTGNGGFTGTGGIGGIGGFNNDDKFGDTIGNKGDITGGVKIGGIDIEDFIIENKLDFITGTKVDFNPFTSGDGLVISNNDNKNKFLK